MATSAKLLGLQGLDAAGIEASVRARFAPVVSVSPAPRQRLLIG